MKKILLILANVAMIAVMYGQPATPCTNCDTIKGRSRNYYYGAWFDTCKCYQSDTACGGNIEFELYDPIVASPSSMNAKRMVTPEPLRIKGLTALVGVGTSSGTQKAPEYLYLFQKGAQNGRNLDDTTMVLLDSVRWDTLTKPRYMQIPRYANSTDYLYCYAYDIYFDKPVTVDSAFYICGSANSNGPENYIRTKYVTYRSTSSLDCRPNDFMMLYERGLPANCRWMVYAPNIFGYYLPIVDNDSLSAVSDDDAKGHATGSGYYPHGHSATIEAVPQRGYVFGYWSDGDTTNPRVVRMTQDTTFVAHFGDAELQTVVAVPDDEAHGYVRGGGSYFPGDTVALTAVPAQGYVFSHWNDGDTTNPRLFVVRHDTTFVAHFREKLSIEAPWGAVAMEVSPNPSHTQFRVSCGERMEELKVISSKGATVVRMEPKAETAVVDVAGWQPGVYVVYARTAKGSAAKKAVVK